MKKIIFFTLFFLTLFGVLLMVNTTIFESSANASTDEEIAVWKAGEVIPYINSKIIIEEENHQEGTRIVTEYIIGNNGEWRSEILEHPSEFGVGMIMVWDTEKFYTYYPAVDSLTIEDNYVKNQKVMAHPLLGSILHSNILIEGKAVEKRPDFDVYSKKSILRKAKDNEEAQIIPAEDRHYVNKGNNKVTKIEKVVNGQIASSIALKEVKKNFNPASSLFNFDLSQIENVEN